MSLMGLGDPAPVHARALRLGKRLGRKLGLRRIYVEARHARTLGAQRYLALVRARQTVLRRVRRLTPIPISGGTLEVHMLLHHARAQEGVWGLYSFVHFSRQPCRVVVHDDGSLTRSDARLLTGILPGCEIVAREVADAAVLSHLARAGLSKCHAFRQGSFLSIKLFDVALMARQPEYVVLDSDVLFFAPPTELIDGEAGVARYSLDVADAYCLSRDEMTRILGVPALARCNTGVVRTGPPDLSLVEHALAETGLWMDQWRGHFHAEQTIWAMELTMRRAAALPPSYATCPGERTDGIVSGHYCGSIQSVAPYYLTGLPHLSAMLGS